MKSQSQSSSCWCDQGSINPTLPPWSLGFQKLQFRNLQMTRMEKLNIHSIFETMNLNISTPTWCQMKMPYPYPSPQPVEKLAADHWYQEPQMCQQKSQSTEADTRFMPD